MNDYKVLEAKCDVSGGGVACGPVFGNVVASVKYEFNNEVKYLTLVEVEGCPCFFLTEKDVFDKFVEDDAEDEEFNDFIAEGQLDYFEDVEFDCDYESIFEGLNEHELTPAGKLVKYIIAIVSMSFEDMNEFINKTNGKYISEIEIPEIDLDEDFMD